MTSFETEKLPVDRDLVASDGFDVRILLELRGGGMAHCAVAAGETSVAVTHRTVEEIWFIVSGRGEMWRKQDEREEIVALARGRRGHDAALAGRRRGVGGRRHKGEGLFNDGRRELALKPGDTVIFPAGEMHTVVALTRMVLYRVQAGANRSAKTLDAWPTR